MGHTLKFSIGLLVALGAYQAFGDVFIDFGEGGIVSVECASGQSSPSSESVAASTDGKPATKWCMEHGNQPSVWIGRCATGMVVSSYAFTSANDMPDRDPRTWTLEGPNDNRTWTLLDRRTKEAPFLERHQRKEYTFANDRKFRRYRLTFSDHGSPTQIDGNFGYTAGVCEMLLQSHASVSFEIGSAIPEIHLLPALPKQWPTGSVKGLLARGGFEVDIAWQDGKLTKAALRSQFGNSCLVRYGSKTVILKTQKETAYVLDGRLAVRP